MKGRGEMTGGERRRSVRRGRVENGQSIAKVLK